MILGLMFLTLSFSSLIGIFYIVSKKVPVLMAIPEEALVSKETFSEFLGRKTKELPSVAKGFHVVLLKSVNKQLLKSKVLSLKIHNKTNIWTEALNKRLHYKKQENKEEEIVLPDVNDNAGGAIATLVSSQDQDERNQT